MKVITSVTAAQKLFLKLKNKKIGLVPTMGALHEGHASLIRKARKENDIVTVSIFVNPLQFGKNEDFKKYPRPMRNDIGICRQNDVDYVFHPDARQFCRADSLTEVGVKKISDVYCGKFRQGHFKGVATIVLKLFNVIQPANVYFGEKDFQQLFIIKKLVRDLNVPVRIIACPTVREKTGLAISSRNAYLNECEKQLAPLIYGTLQEARKKVIRGGLKTAAGVRKFVRTKLSPLIKGVRGLSSPIKIQYIEVINPKTLERTPHIDKRNFRLLIACFVGSTRLIDNV